MWIMFRKKPPCDCAPPPLSIFWSTPWPKLWDSEEEIIQTDRRLVDAKVLDAAWTDWIETEEGRTFFHENGKPGFNELRVVLPFALIDKYLLKLKYRDRLERDTHWHFFDGGMDHDWVNARAIRYKGEKVRVFPDEFTPVSTDNMHAYIADGSHELVAGETSAADDYILGELKTGLQRVVYEEALVDGCDHAQGILMALGGDPTEGMEFPPIGWYKCHPAYKSMFCRWDDLEPEDQEWLEHNTVEPVRLGTVVKRKS